MIADNSIGDQTAENSLQDSILSGIHGKNRQEIFAALVNAINTLFAGSSNQQSVAITRFAAVTIRGGCLESPMLYDTYGINPAIVLAHFNKILPGNNFVSSTFGVYEQDLKIFLFIRSGIVFFSEDEDNYIENHKEAQIIFVHRIEARKRKDNIRKMLLAMKNGEFVEYDNNERIAKPLRPKRVSSWTEEYEERSVPLSEEKSEGNWYPAKK